MTPNVDDSKTVPGFPRLIGLMTLSYTREDIKQHLHRNPPHLLFWLPDRGPEMTTNPTAYAELMRRTPYLARTRGSNLLSRIVRTIEQAATGKIVKGELGRSMKALA